MNLTQDKSAAKHSLDLLDPDADNFTFQTFSDRKVKGADPLAYIFHGTLGECWDELCELNRKGAGVFVTVQETDGHGRKKENITGIRCVFIEDDRGGIPELPLEPHIIVETSPGKRHLYFLTACDNPDEFEAVQQRLVDDYGSDPNAKDRARVLRVPGFYHQKEEPYMVRILHESDAPPYPWETIKKEFPPVARRKKPGTFKKGRRGKRLRSLRFQSVAEVYSAISEIDPDIEYTDWIRVGMALHQATGGNKEGLRLWDEWSKRGQKYREGECVYRWGTFGSRTEVVTLATVFDIAHRHGWTGEYWDDDRGLKYADMEFRRHLGYFSKRHAVVNIQGKATVVYREKDGNLGHWETRFISTSNLETLRETELLPVIVRDKDGVSVIDAKPLVKVWRTHKARKQYDQVVFRPEPGLVAGGTILPDTKSYNLYQGLAYEPVKGDCRLIRRHIGEIWCNGNREAFDYVINWMANMLQNPNERGHTALVLRSGEGAGKNIIVDILVEVFGAHAFVATHPRDLTGQFTAHLATAVLVFANEAIWGGDKSQEGALKSLITDERQYLEQKYLPKFAVRNCAHLIMASNNEWVAPIGIDDRRYLVLDLDESVKGDAKYFRRLAKHIANGGGSAFVHYLLNCDISDFDPRVIPEVDGTTKFDNMIRTAGSVTQWWYECLSNGELVPKDILDANPNVQPTINQQWQKELVVVPNKALLASYQQWAVKNRRRPEHQTSVFTTLQKLTGKGLKNTRPSTKGERMYAKRIARLEDCRVAFEERVNAKISWDQ